MRRLVAPIVLLASLALIPGRTGADVAPDGPEFQVNTYTTGDQTEPKVAADGSGRFVVVWQSGRTTGTVPTAPGTASPPGVSTPPERPPARSSS